MNLLCANFKWLNVKSHFLTSKINYSMCPFQDLWGQFNWVQLAGMYWYMYSYKSRKKLKGLLYVLTSMMRAILGILIIIWAFALTGMAVTIFVKTIFISFACKYWVKIMIDSIILLVKSYYWLKAILHTFTDAFNTKVFFHG